MPTEKERRKPSQRSGHCRPPRQRRWTDAWLFIPPIPFLSSSACRLPHSAHPPAAIVGPGSWHLSSTSPRTCRRADQRSAEAAAEGGKNVGVHIIATRDAAAQHCPLRLQPWCSVMPGLHVLQVNVSLLPAYMNAIYSHRQQHVLPRWAAVEIQSSLQICSMSKQTRKPPPLPVVLKQHCMMTMLNI